MKKIDIVKTVAKNILKYKNIRKISCLNIAKRAGISYATLKNIVYLRINDVKVSTLLKIAAALNVTLDDLVK